MSTKSDGPTGEPSLREGQARAPGSGKIFVTRGSHLRVNEFTIEVNEEGQLKSSDVTLDLAQDVTPFWLEIALGHCEEAKAHHAAVHERVRIAEDQELADALEAEFKSSMQACVAAAVGIDAFYGRVKEFVDMPPATIAAWQDNRTARHAQIAEVLRRGFRIPSSKMAVLKQLLKEVFEWRDLAVHPPPEPDRPVLRPDLHLGLEWRFVTFRLYNARVITKLCISVVWQCSGAPRTRYAGLEKYCKGIRAKVEPIQSKYSDLFGVGTEEEE